MWVRVHYLPVTLLLLIYSNGVQWIFLAKEQHKDGGNHFHGCIDFGPRRDAAGKERPRIYFKTLDTMLGKHGNYKKVHKLAGWLKYISKDGNFRAWSEKTGWSKPYADSLLNTLASKQNNSYAQIEAYLLETPNINLLDIPGKFPGFLLNNSHKIERFIHLQEQAKDRSLLPTFAWPVELNSPNLTEEHDKMIYRWLWLWFHHIKDKSDRPLPKSLPHLVLIGDPNCGKTRLIGTLAKSIPTYYFTDDGGFMDGLLERHELIYFDDFHGNQMRWTDWKKFTGGDRKSVV
jgi:hypothetical protein